MTQKSIEYSLRKALLDNGKMVRALYEYELEEHVNEFIESKKQDRNKYLFAVTENNGDVAMFLIDEDDKIHINEDARSKLMEYWKDSVYKSNMKKLIPQMSLILSSGNLFVTGVKVQ